MARQKQALNPIFPAALEVQRFLKKHRWRFCIIGALAVLRWGEPRATQDVDIALLTSIGKEKTIINAVLDEFPQRVENAREFALQSRVILCNASNGVGVDISLAASVLEEQMIARASRFAFAPRFALVTASAEDLVVLKAFADRDQDWPDVRGIIARQGNQLNWQQIVRDLTGLCDLKEDTTPLGKLETLRLRVARAVNDHSA
jgi:hypothetical protein